MDTPEFGDTPHLAHFEDEDDIYTYLARLNEDGHLPELPSVDARGCGFIATLTDPDADRVNHVVTDEGGRAHGVQDWCDEFCPCNWRATYPVTSLSVQNPATVKREIAKAAREQDERDAARFTKVRAEMSTPPACADCGRPFVPVRRGECSHCGSDAGPVSTPPAGGEA